MLSSSDAILGSFCSASLVSSFPAVCIECEEARGGRVVEDSILEEATLYFCIYISYCLKVIMGEEQNLSHFGGIFFGKIKRSKQALICQMKVPKLLYR